MARINLLPWREELRKQKQREFGITAAGSVVIAGLIVLLSHLHVDGMISDQTQRAFLPSGLPMTVLARKLWRAELSYEEIAEDYFRAAFGPDGRLCRDYLDELSKDFDLGGVTALRRGGPASAPPGAIARLSRVRESITRFRPVIQRNLTLEDPCQAKSWEYLAHHADLCVLLSEAVSASVSGDTKQAADRWRAVETMVTEREGEIHSVFDVFLFLVSMRRKFRLP